MSDIRLSIDLMTEKEKDSVIKMAAEIIKRRIKNINQYYKGIDISDPMRENFRELKKLTKMSIPGFGCFYISFTNAAFGSGANPASDEDHYDPSCVKYFRVLKFRPYQWTKEKSFRMEVDA